MADARKLQKRGGHLRDAKDMNPCFSYLEHDAHTGVPRQGPRVVCEPLLNGSLGAIFVDEAEVLRATAHEDDDVAVAQGGQQPHLALELRRALRGRDRCETWLVKPRKYLFKTRPVRLGPA